MKNKKGVVLSVLFVFFIFGVTIPLFMSNHRKIKADTITDLTGTTWVFNDSQVWTQDINIYLNFTSNNTQFTLFYVFLDDTLRYSYYNSSLGYVRVYNDYWLNQEYRTITITGGGGATDTTFINWLQNHATQQQPTPTGTEITHKYWSPYGVITMTDNQVIGDEEITYTVKYNEFTSNYDETIQTGLKFLGVQANDPNVQWSYIESINSVGINILYHGTTNNINNAMWLEFTYGDYMDTELYDFMDLWGYWFDDANAYLVGTNQGYAEGTQHGIALGQADGTQYTTLISNIFNGIGGLLSIQVFPNITIGLLIGLPLLLGVLVIILKILRG